MTDITTTWTDRPCPICGENERITLLALRTIRNEGHNGDFIFEMHDSVCDICGFVFNRKIPEPQFLLDYYADALLLVQPDYDAQSRINVIKNNTPAGGSVLELGGARAEFADLVRAEGFTVTVKEHRDPWPDEIFDTIVAYYVLEHVADPRGMLLNIRDHLNPGGKVILEVPNFEMWIHSLYREHFNHFTPCHLGLLFYLVGFVYHPDRRISRSYGMVAVGERIPLIPEKTAEIYRTHHAKVGHHWEARL